MRRAVFCILFIVLALSACKRPRGVVYTQQPASAEPEQEEMLWCLAPASKKIHDSFEESASVQKVIKQACYRPKGEYGYCAKGDSSTCIIVAQGASAGRAAKTAKPKLLEATPKTVHLVMGQYIGDVLLETLDFYESRWLNAIKEDRNFSDDLSLAQRMVRLTAGDSHAEIMRHLKLQVREIPAGPWRDQVVEMATMTQRLHEMAVSPSGSLKSYREGTRETAQAFKDARTKLEMAREPAWPKAKEPATDEEAQ